MLAGKKYEIIDAPDDGDCFFWSLAMALREEQKWDVKEAHERMSGLWRKHFIDKMGRNFWADCWTSAEEPQEHREPWIDRLLLNSKWEGHFVKTYEEFEERLKTTAAQYLRNIRNKTRGWVVFYPTDELVKFCVPHFLPKKKVVVMCYQPPYNDFAFGLTFGKDDADDANTIHLLLDRTKQHYDLLKPL